MSIYDNETSKIYPDVNPTAPQEPRAYRLKKIRHICSKKFKFVNGWQKKIKLFNTITSIDDTGLISKCWLTATASYQADYTIYTDESASRGTRNWGAATVVTRGSPAQSEVVTIIKTKGRTFTSSYEEEAAAMESALSWTSPNANHPSNSILFYTDSKSLCEALISSNPGVSSIHNCINSISSSIFIQWIPGNSAIPVTI